MLSRIVQRLTQITPERASPLRLCPLDAYRPLPGEEGRGDWLRPTPGPPPASLPRPPHSAGGAFDVRTSSRSR